MKERCRPEPGLPRRLRPKGTKRKRPATGDAGQPPGLEISAERMLQVKPQDLPSCEDAWRSVVHDADTEEGIHDLRPVGPWRAAGTVPPKNGRVPGAWGCSRCGRGASDTSRAGELAKKPCSGAAWETVQATHQLEMQGEQWQCSRCWLTVMPRHAAQSSKQLCLVPELHAEGARWSQGEASIRAVLGRIRAFRHYCKPPEVKPVPAEPVLVPAGAPQRKRRRAEVGSVEAGPAPFALRPYLGHLVARVGRSLWCLNCFEVLGRDHLAWRHGRCEGARPAVAMPPGFRDGVLRSPLKPELLEPLQSRWAVLAGAARPAS